MQTFNPTQFKVNFPAFNTLSDSYLTNTFNFGVMEVGKVIWGLFVVNSDMEYYWATQVLAHLLTLSNGQNGQQNGSGKVGVTTAATEGSVSGSFNYPVTQDSKWWEQTSYGATCYNLLRIRGGATYWAQGSYNGYVDETCRGIWRR